ncbi:MAG: response regulator transcription factor [Ignavibacteria bacterium]|nr:response regulator transcription factor [Ignavibacteria bacterium]
MKKIRILLLEDNRILRDGITAMITKQPDMHVVGTVDNGDRILTMLEKHKPNIVLLDLGLQSKNCLQIVKLIRKDFPETKLIVMDLIPLQVDVLEFIQAGVSGFILKEANVTEFFKTIRTVFGGAKVLPPHLTGSLFSQVVKYAVPDFKPSLFAKTVNMTNRELQVVELIAEGFTNKEIAQRLNLSTYTVKSHVHNILEKLALHTRVQIAKHSHLSNANKAASLTAPLSAV